MKCSFQSLQISSSLVIMTSTWSMITVKLGFYFLHIIYLINEQSTVSSDNRLGFFFSYCVYMFVNLLDNNTAQPYFDGSLISFIFQIHVSISYHYYYQSARSIRAHPRIWPSCLNDMPKLMIEWIGVREDSLWAFLRITDPSKKNLSKSFDTKHYTGLAQFELVEDVMRVATICRTFRLVCLVFYCDCLWVVKLDKLHRFCSIWSRWRRDAYFYYFRNPIPSTIYHSRAIRIFSSICTACSAFDGKSFSCVLFAHSFIS